MSVILDSLRDKERKSRVVVDSTHLDEGGYRPIGIRVDRGEAQDSKVLHQRNNPILLVLIACLAMASLALGVYQFSENQKEKLERLSLEASHVQVSERVQSLEAEAVRYREKVEKVDRQLSAQSRLGEKTTGRIDQNEERIANLENQLLNLEKQQSEMKEAALRLYALQAAQVQASTIPSQQSSQ